MKAFKEEFAFDERLAESREIIAKYPSRVPVIAEKYSKTDLPEIREEKVRTAELLQMIRMNAKIAFPLVGCTCNRRRDDLSSLLMFGSWFLVPRDMSVEQFIYILSARLHLAPGKALFVFVNDTLPQTAASMDSVYECYKDEDGFLYVCHSSEKTFG